MNFNSGSDSEIIDIAKYLGNPYEDDICISSDEEELNKTEFSEEELRKLCEANKIQVNLTKRNLYYEYEKCIRKRLLKRNKQFKPEYRSKFDERIKRKCSKLYSKYYLKWEKRHEIYKPIRLRQSKRNAIQFLNTHISSTNTNQCINDDVEVGNKETDSFQLSSQRQDKSYPIQFLNINNSNNQCDNNENVRDESEETTNDSQLSSQTVIQKVRNCIQVVTESDNESSNCSDNCELTSQNDSIINFVHVTGELGNQKIEEEEENDNFYDEFTNDIACNMYVTSTQKTQ